MNPLIDPRAMCYIALFKSSTRMVLVLDIPQKLIWHKTKKQKNRNKTKRGNDK